MSEENKIEAAEQPKQEVAAWRAWVGKNTKWIVGGVSVVLAFIAGDAGAFQSLIDFVKSIFGG